VLGRDPDEAAHNYLWRGSIFLPEKGEVAIFNEAASWVRYA
jgi:polyphosphate kinase 2 (PPK2 family)